MIYPYIITQRLQVNLFEKNNENHESRYVNNF